jgi:secondary thiamine-phosphate synthase enzyme
MITQKEITLKPYGRGVHLITSEIQKYLTNLPEVGIINLFVKHTSASITINENADPSVRTDMNNFLDKFSPDNTDYFTHIDEGFDDMPSHIKSSFIGNSINIPITNYKLNMGIWQGIYLLEFRNGKRERKIVITVYS